MTVFDGTATPLNATAPAPSFGALVSRDLARYRHWHRRETVTPVRWRTDFESIVFKGGFHAVLLHRASHRLHRAGWTWLAWLVARLNLTLTGADIEFSACIGPGLLIAHPAGIVIGRGTVIGENATIYQGVTCGIRNWTVGDGSGYPRIGDAAVLFARCSILGGIRLGDNVVVGAHALVTHDLRDGALAECAGATVRDGRGAATLEKWASSR